MFPGASEPEQRTASHGLCHPRERMTRCTTAACASVLPPMARKSLRPHLNQIRTWTRQGRTDAWVAHQLEVTVQQIASFKREAGLLDDEPGAEGAAAASTTRSTCAPRTTPRSPPSSRPPSRRGARPRRRRRPSRPGWPRRGARRDEARAGGARASRAPRRARPPGRERRHAARGHLRPRRGGLRAVARPGRRRRPRLRRALGRPPPGHGDDRGGPDRHPPHRVSAGAGSTGARYPAASRRCRAGSG